MPKQFLNLTPNDANVMLGMAKENLVDFAIVTDPNWDPWWYHKEIAEALQKVERGEIKRLLIQMPPRHGKTDLVSVKFPAWCYGRHPDWPIINGAYSSMLSEKSSGLCRDLVKSERYQAVFPHINVKMDTKAKDYWRVETGEPGSLDYVTGGSYQAIGVGGAGTGFGAKILIIDDPVKNAEEADSEVMRQKVWEWYSTVARTRLETGGATILVMTRWHEDDLAGRCLLTGQGWHVINYPAIAEQDELNRKKGEALWPKKYPVSELDDIRKDTDDRTWFALYQQNPKKSDKLAFDPAWFPTFKNEDLNKAGMLCNRYAMLDMADVKKDGRDYSGLVITDWGLDDKWYLRFIKRYRLDVKEKVDLLFWIWLTWRPLAIGIEQKAFEDQLKPLFDDECARRGVYPIVVQLKDAGRAKTARIIGAIQGRAQHGRILLQEEPTDDTSAFKTELWSFPRGVNDDLIDAAAYCEDIGQRPFMPTQELMAGQVVLNRREEVGYN